MRWSFGKGLLLIVLWLSGAAAVSVVVSNGYEFHSSLTSVQVTWVLLADNVSARQQLSCCFASTGPGQLTGDHDAFIIDIRSAHASHQVPRTPLARSCFCVAVPAFGLN